jgi:hypothetical protein
MGATGLIAGNSSATCTLIIGLLLIYPLVVLDNTVYRTARRVAIRRGTEYSRARPVRRSRSQMARASMSGTPNRAAYLVAAACWS